MQSNRETESRDCEETTGSAHGCEIMKRARTSQLISSKTSQGMRLDLSFRLGCAESAAGYTRLLSGVRCLVGGFDARTPNARRR